MQKTYHSLQFHYSILTPTFTNKYFFFSKLKNLLTKKDYDYTTAQNSKTIINDDKLTQQHKEKSIDSKDSTISINKEETNELAQQRIKTKDFAPFAKQSIVKGLWPTFDRLDDEFIKAHTLWSYENQIYSPFRWTPLIQMYSLSKDFAGQMTRMSRVKNWETRHTKELVDIFLFEALKGTDFDYYYNYKCLPSKACLFHGYADFFIYQKKGNHLPFILVFLAKEKKNPLTKRIEDDFNMAEIVGGASWALQNMTAVDKNIEYVRVLHSNGHAWRMYEFTKKGEFKKTGFYRSSNNLEFNKIYFDVKMQEVIIGLIRYACGMHNEKEKQLHKVYSLLDESKYLTELDPETKAKLDKRKESWKILPKGLRDFFFGYDK